MKNKFSWINEALQGNKKGAYHFMKTLIDKTVIPPALLELRNKMNEELETNRIRLERALQESELERFILNYLGDQAALFPGNEPSACYICKELTEPYERAAKMIFHDAPSLYLRCYVCGVCQQGFAHLARLRRERSLRELARVVPRPYRIDENGEGYLIDDEEFTDQVDALRYASEHLQKQSEKLLEQAEAAVRLSKVF